MRPAGTDSAPNFVVLVQSSLSVMASAITAPEVILMSGPAIEILPEPMRDIGLGRAADGLFEAGVGPSGLQQQIMRAPERHQPAFDGLLAVFDAGRRPQALRCDGADRRQRVLDAVMQLFKNELLQFVGGFALLGVDAGLREQHLGIDTGLLEQQAKAVILGGQEFLR